jgi:hypothetical protein
MVPLGVGNTNGVVKLGVFELDVCVDEAECLTVVVFGWVDARCWCWRKSEEGMGFVDVSEATGDAKVPDMCVRLYGELCWLGSIGRELENNDKKVWARKIIARSSKAVHCIRLRTANEQMKIHHPLIAIVCQ